MEGSPIVTSIVEETCPIAMHVGKDATRGETEITGTEPGFTFGSIDNNRSVKPN